MLHRDRRALRPVFRAHCLLLAVVVSVFAGFWAHAAEHEGFPRTVVDGLGKEIELLSPPQRIFSTALAIDNVLLALVEPERVVGVTRFAQDPEQSYVVDKLRDHMVILDSLNAELVVATNPDIVLAASWNNPDEVRLIEDLGYPVYIFAGFNTVQDALDLVRRVGEITGEDEAAARLIDSFWQQYDDIVRRIEGRERPSVLAWDTWSTTTGLNTSMHDIIEMAGGVNLAAVHGIEGWQTIDAEAVIAMAPEVIVTYESEEFVERLLNDPALQSVPAVQNGRVYAIDHAESATHHVILAIRQLAELLHPEAFEP